MTIFAEVFKDGAWHKVGKVFKSCYPELKGQLTDRVCDEPNNFCLMAILGRSINFWNYGVEKINHNVGLPQDVSAEIEDFMIKKDSICYATLADLLNYDWNVEICKRGYITEWQYKRLKNRISSPVHILSTVSNKEDATCVSPLQMDAILNNSNIRKDTNYYVMYEYNHAFLKELCNFFYETSLQTLISLVPVDGDIDDVRIIYCLGR